MDNDLLMATAHCWTSKWGVSFWNTWPMTVLGIGDIQLICMESIYSFMASDFSWLKVWMWRQGEGISSELWYFPPWKKQLSLTMLLQHSTIAALYYCSTKRQHQKDPNEPGKSILHMIVNHVWERLHWCFHWTRQASALNHSGTSMFTADL